ncbi:uncharacterized protein V6R79_024982 [Siganus canaliculatus]
MMTLMNPYSLPLLAATTDVIARMRLVSALLLKEPLLFKSSRPLAARAEYHTIINGGHETARSHLKCLKVDFSETCPQSVWTTTPEEEEEEEEEEEDLDPESFFFAPVTLKSSECPDGSLLSSESERSSSEAGRAIACFQADKWIKDVRISTSVNLRVERGGRRQRGKKFRLIFDGRFRGRAEKKLEKKGSSVWKTVGIQLMDDIKTSAFISDITSLLLVHHGAALQDQERPGSSEMIRVHLSLTRPRLERLGLEAQDESEHSVV